MSPGGRTFVARGFSPWIMETWALFRPEGGRASLEHLILIEPDSMPAEVYQGLKPLATNVRPPGENLGLQRLELARRTEPSAGSVTMATRSTLMPQEPSACKKSSR